MPRRPSFKDQYDAMEWRIQNRLNTIQERADKLKKYIEKCKAEGGDTGEKDRQWLDQFAIGNGLDIACGDFPITGADGVDGDLKKIGADYYHEGDELVFQQPGSLDFIVSNYLDAFPNPLKALNEWYRTLKVDGVLAVVVRDADAYDNDDGPLANLHRNVLYTEKIIRQYFYRSGFRFITCTKTENKTLRCRGVKK